MGREDAPLVHAEDRATWRAWLEANHATSTGSHLVSWKRGFGPSVGYEEAVEEALCFGWIDSSGGTIDERRSKLYFAPRKPRSGWAATNKARIERLIRHGLMAPAGLAAIERAKENGSWTLLDDVEQGAVPDDLQAALAAQPPAGGAAAGRRQLRGLPEVGQASAARVDGAGQAAGDAGRTDPGDRRQGGPERAGQRVGAEGQALTSVACGRRPRASGRQTGLNASNGWRHAEQWRIERHWVGPKTFSSVVSVEPQ